MDSPFSSVNILAQLAIKAEDLSPEDHRDLGALVEEMRARKAAAAPGSRDNPFLIKGGLDGEELLTPPPPPPQQQLHHLSPLLHHGLYTPQQLPSRPSPLLAQEMRATVKPEARGAPSPASRAPQSGPATAETTASPVAGSSRPKRKRTTVAETSDGGSEFEPDSDDEPLNPGRATRRQSTRGAMRRRRLNDGASHDVPAMPEPMMPEAVMMASEPSSPGCSLPDAMQVGSPPPRYVATVTQKSQSTTALEIACRGTVTFQQAQRENGGNYIFQWPLASRGARIESGDNHFILVCDSIKCPKSKRGYFWRHPFVPIPGHGVPADSHFHGHVTVEQMLEQYGWNVVDAGQHLDEIQAYNAMLAKKPIPAAKRPRRQARD